MELLLYLVSRHPGLLVSAPTIFQVPVEEIPRRFNGVTSTALGMIPFEPSGRPHRPARYPADRAQETEGIQGISSGPFCSRCSWKPEFAVLAVSWCRCRYDIIGDGTSVSVHRDYQGSFIQDITYTAVST